jgi:hypothetical protein
VPVCTWRYAGEGELVLARIHPAHILPTEDEPGKHQCLPVFLAALAQRRVVGVWWQLWRAVLLEIARPRRRLGAGPRGKGPPLGKAPPPSRPAKGRFSMPCAARCLVVGGHCDIQAGCTRTAIEQARPVAPAAGNLIMLRVGEWVCGAGRFST